MSETIHLIILIAHVLGATIIVGGVFASLLILIKEKIAKDNLKFVSHLWRILAPAIGLQLVTGLLLAANEWNEYGKNPYFWAKIILLVVDGFYGGKVLGERINMELSKDKKTYVIPGAKRIIWFSFLLFALIATLGVILAESHKD
jgi:uncharacterized membrane protein